MKPIQAYHRFASLTPIAATLSMVGLTHAASDSWDGSTDATWATATNWVTDTSAPGAGETATFNSAGNGNTTIDLGAGITLGSLVFDTASAAPYTIGAGAVGSQTLTLGTTGNAIAMNAGVASNQTVNSNLALTVTRTVATPGSYYAVANDSLTNGLTLAGGISASTAGVKVLNVTGSGNAAISGAIASGTGNMSLFKTGTGTLTLSGGATFSGNGVTDGSNFASSAVFREGTTILDAGTYNLSNTEPVIGGVATHGGAGTDATLQLNNGAILNNISWLSIGRGNGIGGVSSNLTLNGTSSVTTTNLSAGFNAGNAGNLPKGAIALSNNSTLTVTSTAAGTNANTATFKIGESAGSDVTLTVNDSAVVNRTAGSLGFGNQEQGALQIGREGKGTVTMNGGTINVASTDLGRGVNNATAQNGALTIKTGATYNNEGDFRTGFAGGASGQATLNLEGGTLNIGTTTARTLYVGCWDLSQSTLNIQSGNLNLNTNSNIRFNQSSGVGAKVINLNGGAITSFSDNKITANGSGVLDMMQVGGAGSNNTFNLNGGTLSVRQVVSTTNNGTRTFNFNGGTLKATGDSAAFFNLGTGIANVRNNPAIINTNGFNVTAAQAIQHSNIVDDNVTDGGLTKQGLGTLTLSGFSSYNGPTTVSAGTLNVTGDISTSALSLGAGTLSGSGTVGPVTVNNSAAVVSNANASSLTASALAFTTTGTANLNVSESSTPIVVTNDLNIGAGFTVNVASGPTWNNNQTYDLISYGTLTGAPGSITKGTIAGLGARQDATLGNSGSAITLSITGDTPVWTGAQSNAWTTAVVGGSKNWKLQTAGTAVDFLNNDQVRFDDTATGTTDINISTANVQVASVVFDNSGVSNAGRDYTISSSGGFGIVNGPSPASLLKNGDGPVTLKTINGYTGATTINAGTLQLGDGVTDGDIATSSAIVANGKLVFNRSAGSFTYGNVISGFGTIDKNGAGTQILTGDNTFAGIITNNAGILQVGNGGTTGSLGTSSVTNNASLVFNRSNAFTFAGIIDGTGSVTQAGTGAVTFSGNNSYSGGTTISPGGTILIGGNNALGTGTVTLANGVVLGTTNPGGALPNAIVAPAGTTATLATSGSNLTLNGNISGSGNLNRTATGAAASVFLAGDNSGFSGTFTVENNANAATRFISATSGSANAKWVINQPTSTRASVDSPGNTILLGSLTGTGFLTAQGNGTTTIEVGNLGLNETFAGVLNQAGAGVLSVTKVGSGRWTLTGTNAYTGDTTVNGGVLVTDGGAIPDAGKVVINGGQVEVGFGTEVVGTLFFGGTQKAAGTWGAPGSAAQFTDAHFVGLNGVLSVTTGPVAGYTTWADANAPGQTMEQDHDNDGVDNGIEYFMGATGSTFTANPVAVGGTITWPMGAAYAGVYGTDYQVQTSTTLGAWDNVVAGSVTIVPGTSVAYTLPGGDKLFVRLVVNN